VERKWKLKLIKINCNDDDKGESEDGKIVATLSASSVDGTLVT
jgi:hypothetical protein